MTFLISDARAIEHRMDDQSRLAALAPDPVVSAMHLDLARFYREQLIQVVIAGDSGPD